MKRKRKILSIILSLLTCILLFCSWGEAEFGGEVKLGKIYTDPVGVEGAYPRGVFESLETFSEEIDGFQEQCELFGMILMSVFIFLVVLELFYIIFCVVGFDGAYYMGIVTEVLVILVVLLGVILAYVFGDSKIAINDHFRLVSEIEVNLIPFFMILFELVGKNLCAVKKFD